MSPTSGSVLPPFIAVQPGQLLNNEFMLQKLLSEEETGEVWRALEFNVGRVVRLHFLPKTTLSVSKIKKRLQTQIKEWQTSQKPGLVLPVRWDETPEGLIFLASPHTDSVLPEHYAAQWIQESFVIRQTTAAPEQDIYLLAEKIVPSEILNREEKRKKSESLPQEEPSSYKFILAAARPASAQKLKDKIYKERKFQRAFRIWVICVFIGVLTAAYLFREPIIRLWQ